jgi:glycosyltransferase involved in cell wall biosynthesis
MTSRGPTVAIVERQVWAPWSPDDIEHRGLGGSQTSMVRLARELVRQGYRTSVFGWVDPIVDHGVSYAPSASFSPDDGWDVVIGARNPRLLTLPLTGAKRILWAHDIHYGDALDPPVASHVDAVVCPSMFHANFLVERYPHLAGRVHVVPNGIELAWYRERADRRPLRVVYSSAPERGLDVLLEIWPAVRGLVPDAELWYCSAPVYATRGRSERLRSFTERVTVLSGLPGVRSIGSLGQPELARLLCESSVWVAPAWQSTSGTPCIETFCIAALEAQAAGCHVVATKVGALAETVQAGHLLTSRPGSGAWRLELYDGILAGLLDPSVRATAREKGPQVAASFGVRDTLGGFGELLERVERTSSP